MVKQVYYFFFAEYNLPEMKEKNKKKQLNP